MNRSRWNSIRFAHIVPVLVLAMLIGPMVTRPIAGGAMSTAKAFGAASIPVGGTTSLTFTLTNLTGSPITAAAFTDILPAGLQLGAGVPTIGPGCGLGSLGTTLPSTINVSFSIPGLSSCLISLNVIGVGTGTQ